MFTFLAEEVTFPATFVILKTHISYQQLQWRVTAVIREEIKEKFLWDCVLNHRLLIALNRLLRKIKKIWKIWNSGN